MTEEDSAQTITDEREGSTLMSNIGMLCIVDKLIMAYNT